jgi:DNA polymerase II small subunit/DNA polymerase delta subunit B
MFTVHGSTPSRPLPTPHAKGKSADLAKSTKVSKTGVKSEAAVVARKAKKSSAANSTADAGAKSTKSGKKAPVLADAKAKANATVVSKEESVAEVEVEEDVVLTKQAEEGTNDLISEFRDLPSRLQETLMPDLARLSQHSKAYLFTANVGIADGVR